MEKFLDLIGQALFILTFAAPLIIVPLVWKIMDGNKVVRVIMGLILSAICSWVFYCMSLGVLFMHGLGPG